MDFPRPTTTTAAIVVISMCFIYRSISGAGWFSLPPIYTRKTRWEYHWDTGRRGMTPLRFWGETKPRRFGFIKRFNMITPHQKHGCDCD
ncbi:uncharacterized protein METZ01_LOCUS344528 [marine metagenome]|uniref:Uncharacterized protein n=1 Tax=marine metagenome TaxID=408172 RepID=A0A382R1Q1_9ZZZZ